MMNTDHVTLYNVDAEAAAIALLHRTLVRMVGLVVEVLKKMPNEVGFQLLLHVAAHRALEVTRSLVPEVTNALASNVVRYLKLSMLETCSRSCSNVIPSSLTLFPAMRFPAAGLTSSAKRFLKLPAYRRNRSLIRTKPKKYFIVLTYVVLGAF